MVDPFLFGPTSHTFFFFVHIFSTENTFIFHYSNQIKIFFSPRSVNDDNVAVDDDEDVADDYNSNGWKEKIQHY